MKYMLMVFIAIITFSCHKAEDKGSISELNKKVNDVDKIADAALSDSTKNISNSLASSILHSGSPDWDKKIIKTADLNLELKNYNNFNTTVHQSLRNHGAYIAQEQQLQSEGQISNTVSIKVPVEQFEDLLNFLSSFDKDARVLDKQISSEDVSAQVVDTKSRVEAKKKLRDKYFEIMNQSKKMDDVIRIQNEISSITEDIEAASGRVEYLSHQSAYSTINLKYYQVLDAAKIDDISPSFFTSVANAFKQGGSIITNLFLFFVNIWPLVIGGIFAWYIIKRRVLKPKPQQLH